MMQTAFFGTPWVAPIGFILQTLILISIIWFPKTRDADNEYWSKYIKAIRGFPMALLFFFGVLYIDVFVSVVLLQGYPAGTWMNTYPSAVLALLLGVEWVSMAVLVNPNWKTVISAIEYVTLYILVLKVLVPATENDWNVLFLVVIMAVVAGLHEVMLATEKIVKHFKKGFSGDAPLWSARRRFKRIFNVPVNVVLWALVMVETILVFMGYSLITVFL